MWIVTGSSGFVGGHVVAKLGREAVGLSRGQWGGDGLRRAFKGADAVVHAASVVHRPSTRPEEYTRFNVEGTRLLIDAARAAGVRKLVFVSSIKVHGETPLGVIDETTPIAAVAHYARTKAEAEKLILGATDLRPVVLRLCPVYGRGDKGNIRTMIRAIARRRFFVPGDGSTRKSVVHVSTVADVVRGVLTKDVQGIFVVADRSAPSIRELANTMARALGRHPSRSIPIPVLRGAASLVGRVASLMGISTPISAELIDKAMASSVCDPSRVERELGVACSVDLDAALRDEIAWLRQLGAI